MIVATFPIQKDHIKILIYVRSVVVESGFYCSQHDMDTLKFAEYFY
jgi:hypothetical protein